MERKMAEADAKVRRLEEKLRLAREELQSLKQQRSYQSRDIVDESAADAYAPDPRDSCPTLALPLSDYRRYGRQLLLPQVGVPGQQKLRIGSALIVGAGGLGCPAAAYLAGAGVGKIGLVDGDTVETSNLHRQILHSTNKVGWSKVESIADYIDALNPDIECVTFQDHLRVDNALNIVSQFDIVLDCTDVPASRYLVSDTCVRAQKPLVFASALRTEGQLMVLNNPPRRPGDPEGGPCYRCIWPQPPPPEAVSSCGESGILGPVVGLLGVMMALEALKILVKDTSRHGSSSSGPQQPTLLLFSAFRSPQFMPMKMRGRRLDCKACASESLPVSSEDYEQFCGSRVPVRVLAGEERQSPLQVSQALNARDAPEQAILVDVREKADWDVFHLPESVNIPWSTMAQYSTASEIERTFAPQRDGPIHVMCRLGNDSQLAVQKMKSVGIDQDGKRYIGDVEGGWVRWRKTVPGSWPDY